jgi:hypothetical protein
MIMPENHRYPPTVNAPLDAQAGDTIINETRPHEPHLVW